MVRNWILQYRWRVYTLFLSPDFFFHVSFGRCLFNDCYEIVLCWPVKLGVDCRVGVNNGLEMMVNQTVVACRNGDSYATIIYIVHIHVWLCSYNCYGVKSRKFFRHDTLTMSRLLTRHLYYTKRQFKSLAAKFRC